MSRTTGAHRTRKIVDVPRTSVGERLWTKSGGRARKIIDKLGNRVAALWSQSGCKFDISISAINLGRRRVRRWAPKVRTKGLARSSPAPYSTAAPK